jgi:very-short-patch-repair endonuclease
VRWGKATYAARPVELAGHGYQGIRFWNNKVFESIGGVPHVVLRALQEEAPTLP